MTISTGGNVTSGVESGISSILTEASSTIVMDFVGEADEVVKSITGVKMESWFDDLEYSLVRFADGTQGIDSFPSSAKEVYLHGGTHLCALVPYRIWCGQHSANSGGAPSFSR